MVRTRRPAQTAPEPVPEPDTMDTLPSNVLPLWLGLQPSATPTPNLQTSATKKKGKKSIPDRGLHMPVSAFQVIDQADLSPSPANPSTLSVEEFRRLIEGMKRGELRKQFRLEANSHRDIVERCGRGEAILDPEFTEFRLFLWHLGPRPVPTWSVDRIDNTNPVYGPGLCRWASPRQQANNRGITVHLTARGEIRPLTEWARLTNQNPKTLAKRLERGWKHEEVVAGRRGVVAPQGVEPPARPPQRADEWPEGTKDPTGWEAAYLGFGRAFPEFGASRAAFMAWLCNNIADRARQRLGKAFPRYQEGYDPEPAGYVEDPAYVMRENAEERVRAALRAMGDDIQQQEIASALHRRWGDVRDPKIAAKLVRRDEEGE